MDRIQRSPWLSVIVPVFNAERYLNRCIEAVLKQSFCDFELLLVDDGSTDRTGEICRESVLKDSRIHYLFKENSGPLEARLFGTRSAKGEYILFCDADDYYCDRKAFEKLHDAVEKFQPDVIEFGFYKHYKHLKSKRIPAQKQEYLTCEDFQKRDYPRLLCSYWDSSKLTTTVWDKLYDRHLLGYLPDKFERVFMGDDIILNLYLLQNCSSVLYMPEVFYCYFSQTGSSGTWKKSTMYDLDQIKKYQRLFLSEWQGNDKEKITATLNAETACWLFAHVKDGLSVISESELTGYVADVLKLTEFIQTRNYYLTQSDVDWLAFRLIRHADPDEYVAEAKLQVAKDSDNIKTKAKKWIISKI